MTHAPSEESEQRVIEPNMFAQSDNVLGWMAGNTEPVPEDLEAEETRSTTDVKDAEILVDTASHEDEFGLSIQRMREFLSDNLSFKWLGRRIETLVTTTAAKSFETITHELIRGLQESTLATYRPVLRVSVDWNLEEFISCNYASEVELASIICINSDGHDFEADTLGDYMARIWPMSGTDFLQILQEWWRQRQPDGEQEFKRKFSLQVMCWSTADPP